MKTIESIQTYYSGSYPTTTGINSTGAATQDGTEYIAEQLNNSVFGPQQAIMNYAGLTPDGVIEADGTAQILDAIGLGWGVGPGFFVKWGLADTPSITGHRILMTTGQGIIRASYQLLDAAVYVGDPSNPTAPYFYHADDAAGTTRNTSGIYLILPESRDYVFLSGPRVTESRWNTVSGYGSVNNKIRTFTNNTIVSDDVVVTVVNSATNGFSITANIDCKIKIGYSDQFTSGNWLGFSLNSTQLTTSILTITTADKLITATTASVDFACHVSFSGKLSAGDVVRPHTSGTASGATPANTGINILATELPRENSDTIIGITY